MSMLMLHLIFSEGNRVLTTFAINGEVVVRWLGKSPLESISFSFAVTRSASVSVIEMSP